MAQSISKSKRSICDMKIYDLLLLMFLLAQPLALSAECPKQMFGCTDNVLFNDSVSRTCLGMKHPRNKIFAFSSQIAHNRFEIARGGVRPSEHDSLLVCHWYFDVF